MTTVSFAQRLDEARSQLQEGHPQRAYALLHPVFEQVDLPQEPDSLASALAVFAEVSMAIAGPDFSKLAQAAADAVDNVGTLFALGYECIEQQLWGPAACVLERARTLAPGDVAVLGELVSALESDGRHGTARDRLRQAPALLGEHFELRFQLAYNTLLVGDIAGAKSEAGALGSPQGPDQTALKGTLDAMLARASAIGPVAPLDTQDLRGWHFVSSGGLLLHLSPLGFHDGMNGRYAMTQDSAVRCRQGLLRVHAVLDEWDAVPERVLLLPDQDSHVLGVAAAAMFGVDAQPFEEGVAGLIVAYDLSTLHPSTPAAVAHHHPDQVLFAHATCWTEPPPCVADLTTYLYAANVPPGSEPNAGGTAPRLADTSDPQTELSVQTILDAIVDDDPDELPSDALARVVEFAEVARSLSAASASEGLRPRMWDGGPVRSERFG